MDPVSHRRSQSKGGPARSPCSPASFPPLQLPSWADASMPDPETAGVPRAWAGPPPAPKLDQASSSTLRVPPSISVLFPNRAQPSPLTSLQLCPLESTHPPVRHLGSLARGRAPSTCKSAVTAGLNLPGARHWPPPVPHVPLLPLPLSQPSSRSGPCKTQVDLTANARDGFNTGANFPASVPLTPNQAMPSG